MSNGGVYHMIGNPNSNGQALAPAPAIGIPLQMHHHGAPSPGQLIGSNSSNGQENSGLIYDLSSFDPLQAHALQLTASAGLTNLLAPQSAPNGPHQHNGIGENNQQTQHMQNIAQQQVQHQFNAQQSYYYMQPQAAAPPSSLQPIAPAIGHGLSPGPAPQGFILPVHTQNVYSQQILPSNTMSGAGPAQTVIPNLLMTKHLQSVVAGAAQHPAPLAPAINPSQKREPQELGSGDGPASKKRRQLAPSVVSSSTNSRLDMKNFVDNLDCKPPQEASQADLDRMTPAERRRYERNLREQQRSYKISQQIKELRDVLAESNVPYKPNKYSILLSVVDYIKQLQSRAIMLDAEHQKLITTIRQTNEMVTSGTTPSSADEMDGTNTTNSSESGSDTELLFVQGLDYRSIFAQSPVALAIASLDGRIMECNAEFQILIGFARDDLLKQSLFNLVRNHHDIFRSMAEMLKGAENAGGGGSQASDMRNRYWNGEVSSKNHTKLSMNLTLTVADDGTPKFFNCALTSI